MGFGAAKIIKKLQYVPRQIGQSAPFPPDKVYMRKEFLSQHFVCQISKTVRMHVQVRLVNLVNISCKNEFAAFPGPGNDRLYFMGGKVL